MINLARQREVLEQLVGYFEVGVDFYSEAWVMSAEFLGAKHELNCGLCLLCATV